MPDDSLYVMSPNEIVLGWLFGHLPEQPTMSSEPVGTPREALERVVREALLRPPCGVAFSGGRDSSVVLAVATHVARRDGLDDPVPITRVFPGVAEAEEDQWQEMVVRHLGLKEWQRVNIGGGDLDFVGPLAARHLLPHGVVWPPAIAADIPLIEALPGGSIIDGEGGDEVFGVLAHRVAPVTALVRRPRPVRWRRVRRALAALAPAPIRARRVRDRWRNESLWLRPVGRELYLDAHVAAERARPLSFSSSVSMILRARAQRLWTNNRRILARPSNTDLSSPLLHPDVVRAVARDGGVVGRGDRTMVLCELVPDLLPDKMLSRTAKATFNGCYMARHTREFAGRWDGEGVDHELVDPEGLRRAWLAEWPSPMTAALLQQAWRATQEPSRPPTG